MKLYVQDYKKIALIGISKTNDKGEYSEHLIWWEVRPNVWIEDYEMSLTLRMSRKNALKFLETYKHILWRNRGKKNP